MVVVFGGINVDGVVLAERLPRPGETVVGAHYALHPGGKGANQAVAAARSGARTAMVGCVGEDANASVALDALRGAGVNIDHVRLNRDLPTAYASVWVDAQGENQIIVASGANVAIDAEQLGPLLDEGNTVLFQLEIPLEQNRLAIAQARARGARILLNAAPFAPLPTSMLESLDVLVVNEIEAAGLAQAMGQAGTDALESARGIARRLDLACVVTLGGAGAVAFRADDVWEVSALEVEAVDTTGAGDAFVGVLAGALDNGATLAEALPAASVAGALACTRVGAQSALPTRAEITAELERLPPVQSGHR